MPENLNQRARNVRLVLMDVDGVLTDGRITFIPDGDGFVEIKSFHVADGAGIALAHQAGLKTGIISGRTSKVVSERARELSIEEVHLGKMDKATVLDGILARTGIPLEEIAFAGDEVVDLPVMRRVGFPVAVQNAPEEVKAHAAYVTQASGGEGAVREMLELILKAQGKWDEVISDFLS